MFIKIDFAHFFQSYQWWGWIWCKSHVLDQDGDLVEIYKWMYSSWSPARYWPVPWRQQPYVALPVWWMKLWKVSDLVQKKLGE